MGYFEVYKVVFDEFGILPAVRIIVTLGGVPVAA